MVSFRSFIVNAVDLFALQLGISLESFPSLHLFQTRSLCVTYYISWSNINRSATGVGGTINKNVALTLKGMSSIF